MSNEPVSLGEVVSVVRETDKALCVELDGGVEQWVPKSVIHDDSEVWNAETTGELIVKYWWAEKNGLA